MLALSSQVICIDLNEAPVRMRSPEERKKEENDGENLKRTSKVDRDTERSRW